MSKKNNVQVSNEVTNDQNTVDTTATEVATVQTPETLLPAAREALNGQSTFLPEQLNDDAYVDALFTAAAERKDAGLYVEATAKYLQVEDLTKGAEFAFVATGLSTIKVPDETTGELKEVKVCKLYTREKEQVICGAAVLVKAVENLPSLPKVIYVTNHGKMPGKRYNDIRVFYV